MLHTVYLAACFAPHYAIHDQFRVECGFFCRRRPPFILCAVNACCFFYCLPKVLAQNLKSSFFTAALRSVRTHIWHTKNGPNLCYAIDDAAIFGVNATNTSSTAHKHTVTRTSSSQNTLSHTRTPSWLSR